MRKLRINQLILDFLQLQRRQQVTTYHVTNTPLLIERAPRVVLSHGFYAVKYVQQYGLRQTMGSCIYSKSTTVNVGRDSHFCECTALDEGDMLKRSDAIHLEQHQIQGRAATLGTSDFDRCWLSSTIYYTSVAKVFQKPIFPTSVYIVFYFVDNTHTSRHSECMTQLTVDASLPHLGSMRPTPPYEEPLHAYPKLPLVTRSGFSRDGKV